MQHHRGVHLSGYVWVGVCPTCWASRCATGPGWPKQLLKVYRIQKWHTNHIPEARKFTVWYPSGGIYIIEGYHGETKILGFWTEPIQLVHCKQ